MLLFVLHQLVWNRLTGLSVLLQQRTEFLFISEATACRLIKSITNIFPWQSCCHEECKDRILEFYPSIHPSVFFSLSQTLFLFTFSWHPIHWQFAALLPSDLWRLPFPVEVKESDLSVRVHVSVTSLGCFSYAVAMLLLLLWHHGQLMMM